MKKLLILIVLLIIPIVTAQTVNFISGSVAPGEIFQAEISQEKISPTDIRILNPYGYPTAFGINFAVLDENYYFIYTTIPENSLAGEYNFKVKGEDFKFQVLNPKDSFATFSPIFIVYNGNQEYYKIKVFNYGLQETEYTITSEYEGVTPSVSSLIVPGKSTKSFNIYIDSRIKKSLITNLLINNYKIPIYIVKDVFPTQIFTKETTVSKDQLLFYIEGTQINYIKNTLIEQKPLEGELVIKNNLDSTLGNLTITLTGNLDQIVKLNKYEIKELKPGESITLELDVNKERELTEKVYDGSLVIGSVELPINFEVEESDTESKKPEPLTVEEETEEIPEEQEPEKKSYKRYFGFIIIILLAAILYYYYFGKKEHKKEIKFVEYIKKFKK